MVADITHEDGSFIAHNQLVVKLKLSRRKCRDAEYQLLKTRVTYSSVGGALEAGGKCDTAWHVDQAGQRVWLCEEDEWYMYRPQDNMAKFRMLLWQPWFGWSLKLLSGR